MTKDKAIKKIQNRVRVLLNPPTKGLSKQKFGKTRSIAYQLVGEKIGVIMPLFKDLDKNLARSGLKVSVKTYVSIIVFTTVLITFAVSTLISLSLFFFFNTPLSLIFLWGLGVGLFTFAFSIIGFYLYPIYHADKLRRKLDDELPFTTGYMAILASAGVLPEKIFYSLSNMRIPLTVSYESKNVVRDINLFGLDIISSLQNAAKRTPSKKFHELLEGLISTIHSGGNLAAYLRGKSTLFMKLQRIRLKRFLDNLSILSEVYVALLLTGPLLLVIMLSVMAMLGGDSPGIPNLHFLLNIISFIGIPIGTTMFLIALDAASPKW